MAQGVVNNETHSAVHKLGRFAVLAVMGRSFLCAALFFCVQGSISAAATRELTSEDAAKWNRLKAAQLTASGDWFIYFLQPAKGDATLVIRSTREEKEFRYAVGELQSDAGKLRIAPSERRIAFLVTPLSENSETAVTPIKAKSLILADLSTGLRREFQNVCSTRFDEVSETLRSKWIAVVSCARSDGDRGQKMLLINLDEDSVEALGYAAETVFSSAGDRLAWIGTDGIYVRDLYSGRTRVLQKGDPGAYQKLTWSPRGSALAVLRNSSEAGSNASDAQSELGIVCFTGLEKNAPQTAAFYPDRLVGFPENYRITGDAAARGSNTASVLRWREDERGLFFWIRSVVNIQKQTPSDSTDDVVRWHWRDARLSAHKRAEEMVDTRSDYLSFVSIDNGRFIRLSDAALDEVIPHVNSAHLLGFSEDSRQFNITGRRYRNYYLVDVRTGKRKLLVERLLVPPYSFLYLPPTMSPDGSSVLFFSNCHYFAYEVAASVLRNLTAGLPAAFCDKKSLQIGGQIGLGEREQYPILQGWTSDNQHALVSDYYDVWALALKGGRTVNLTKNGRRQAVRYIRTDLGHREERDNLFPYDERSQYADLQKSLYFRFIDLHTRRTGLARSTPGGGSLELLRAEDALIRFQKAQATDIFVYTRQTAVEFPDYYLADRRWQPTVRLTHANPQQSEIRWSPGARLLSYTTARGDKLQGVLHLPADYVPGNAYPTVVTIYELLSHDFHQYRYPTVDGHMLAKHDVPRWTQNGYAVLEPDIRPRLRDGGRAAVEAVTRAVQVAAATGVVDLKRLGLEGHSYGGYETSYIVTRTNIFKAAIAMSGTQNLLSWYGEVYGGQTEGKPVSAISEIGQPYLGGPWWNYWNAYFRNSPLFGAKNIKTPLLLVHGDQDRRVHFSQSVELFNTLRRLGGKEVVLLQYADEGHVISKARNLRDLSHRRMEFFNHFLKGHPAPAWWSGVNVSNSVAPRPRRTGEVT